MFRSSGGRDERGFHSMFCLCRNSVPRYDVVYFLLVGVNCAPVHQVLPPMPGYIPVYIQHGDSVPEDTLELAKLFRLAGSNEPPTDVVQLSVLAVPDTSPSDAPGPSPSPIPGTAGEKAPTTSNSPKESPENDVETSDGVKLPESDKFAAPDKNIDFSDKKPQNSELGNLPDDLEISPDILPAMIDASKQDAEESKNSESQKEPEKDVTENSATETATTPGTTSSA